MDLIMYGYVLVIHYEINNIYVFWLAYIKIAV